MQIHFNGGTRNLGELGRVHDPNDHSIRHAGALMGVTVSHGIDMKSCRFNANNAFILTAKPGKKDARRTRHDGMTDCLVLCTAEYPPVPRRSCPIVAPCFSHTWRLSAYALLPPSTRCNDFSANQLWCNEFVQVAWLQSAPLHARH